METIQQNSQVTPLIVENDSGLDFKQLLYTFFQYWYWFVASIIFCLLVAFLYLRYTTPVYKINSKILIKDDNSNSSSSTQDLLSQIDLFNTKNNVNNEKQILQTHFLLQQVVEELQLNVTCFSVGKIKSTEIYKNGPFKVQLVSLKDSVPTQKFVLKFLNNGTAFTVDNNSRKYNLNDTVKASNASFIVQPNDLTKLEDVDYEINISTPDATTENYLNNLSFDINDKEASVIQITLQESMPAKGEDILNKVYDVYTRMNEEDKDKIADSTINFINGRLAVVESELSGVEKNIEQFKVKNQLSTDLQDQAKLVLDNVSDVQKQLTTQDVQISVVQAIEDHLKQNGQRVVPNAAVIQDPTYIATVQQYNDLVLARDRELETTKPDNPVVKNLDNQIEGVKNNLLISLNNIQNQMQISRNELAEKNSQLLGQIKSSPGKERVFLDISRQQDVKQQLYLYLLQKREETAISKSGNLSNSRLIEPGKSDTLPFTPKRSLIYLISLCAGILLPASGVYLKNILNNKIADSADVSKETTLPIIGEIGHNSTGKTIVAEQNSRTSLAEQFRAFRTNLQFLLKGKENQIIMITSSTSGEGKSFLTINLGSSLAISNKKVVLVELDLRKPKISKEFGLSIENGFTDYLVSKAKKEQIIKSTSNPNLFLISSGTIPPNPAELLLSSEVDELFAWLKTQFDYVIVDTPPAGIVIDPVLIGRLTDASIYVVRQKYTLKQQLQIANDFKENKKMNNLSILVNDVRFDKRYGYYYGNKYGYRYSYGYGYSSDYYSDNKKKNNLFSKMKKS